ncbi:MAG: hypothetical protein CEE40_10245 [Chloroflexi bacterium B3_Chlor]|nr:MAG: hypothetical protein CEE40_10245 [Chloroflexi bacterium B3_Chlor]
MSPVKGDFQPSQIAVTHCYQIQIGPPEGEAHGVSGLLAGTVTAQHGPLIVHLLPGAFIVEGPVILLMITQAQYWRRGGLLFHRVVDRMGIEIRLHHPEIVESLVLLMIAGPFEEPIAHYSHPGPLCLSATICRRRVLSLQLLADPPIVGKAVKVTG